MDIKKVGVIRKHSNGALTIVDWVITDCSYPPTQEEVEQMIALAKEHGTYIEETVPSDLSRTKPIDSIMVTGICHN